MLNAFRKKRKISFTVCVSYLSGIYIHRAFGHVHMASIVDLGRLLVAYAHKSIQLD